MSEVPKRLTVVEYVNHQDVEEEPFQICSRFSRELESREEPYSRNITATKEWKLLDCGWLGDRVGMLVIKNRAGIFTKNPTEEEKEKEAKKTLEISYSKDKPYASWFIPPTESFRGFPNRPTKLFIRSLGGPTKYQLTLIPS